MPGNSVHIRPLRLREVGALRDLFLQALTDDFTYFPAEQINHVRRQNTALRFARAWLSRRRVVLVAEQHGALVGFAISATHRDRLGHLYWLYVNPALRHQKVGKKLLDASLEAMRSRGMTAVELVTYNIDGYYAKHGFWRRTKISRHGTDLHVMQFDFPENQVHRPRNVSRWVIRWPFWVGLMAAVGGIVYAQRVLPAASFQVPSLILPPPKPVAGTIDQITQRQHYTAAQVSALARQNYGSSIPASQRGVTRIQLRYRTTAHNGSLITDYATAYIPDNVKGAPVVAMASGTTGLTAACAVSVENPAAHNWANYQSHLMAYASKGVTGVITDYDDMRGAGSDSVQPYLIGEAEGRAVLDSVRALKRLPEAQYASDFSHTFTAGYSQGGHAALWADALRSSYAPDVKIIGAVAWGGVFNISTTWAGITHGSTLVWFGPYILTAFEHYYGHDYQINNILTSPWNQRLGHDALAHCIDSDIPFYGVKPEVVYTPQFLADLGSGLLTPDKYGPLADDLASNEVTGATSTPKLINQGAKDNVVLAAQQPPAVAKICAGGGPVEYALAPEDTHYNSMVHSFAHTLAWMDDVIHHRALTNNCAAAAPGSSPAPSPTPTSVPGG